MIIVRDARPQDGADIIRLRDSYYARRGTPVQVREGARWVVADAAGRVVATQSYLEASPEGQRFVADTYADHNREGILGLKAIDAAARDEARRDRVVLIGYTEPDNHAHMNAACKRGWRPVAVALAWDPSWEEA
jgi:hypothetical protein